MVLYGQIFRTILGLQQVGARHTRHSQAWQSKMTDMATAS